jgi:hypothetical protein
VTFLSSITSGLCLSGQVSAHLIRLLSSFICTSVEQPLGICTDDAYPFILELLVILRRLCDLQYGEDHLAFCFAASARQFLWAEVDLGRPCLWLSLLVDERTGWHGGVILSSLIHLVNSIAVQSFCSSVFDQFLVRFYPPECWAQTTELHGCLWMD